MGADIHVRIIKRNSNGKWESVKLYTKENKKIKKINFYPFRNYELFDIITGKRNDNFPSSPIYMSDIPIDVLNEIKIAKKPEMCCYNFYEANLADLKLYINSNPKIRDYDYESKNDEDFEKNGWKDNPVIYFVKRIEDIIDIADPFWDFFPPSNVRILYWFDC